MKTNFRLFGLIFLAFVSIGIVACSSDDDESSNPVSGTTWARDYWIYSTIYGGNWYEYLEFGKDTYTRYLKDAKTNVAKDRKENKRYVISGDMVILNGFVNNSDTLYLVGTQLRLNRNSSYNAFEKQ